MNAHVWLAALAAGAVVHLVYVLATAWAAPEFPLGFFVAHLTWVTVIQLGLALALGWAAQGRAWAAAALVTPVALAAAPLVARANLPLGLPLLASGALGCAAWITFARRPGAPIAAAGSGAALACALHWAGSLARQSPPVWVEAGAFSLLAALVLAAGYGLRRLPAALGPRSARAYVLLALVATLLAAVVAASRRDRGLVLAERPTGAPGGPPAVLIVLDSLRADHLALYGYHRNTMPSLERFAKREAVVVRQAIAASSWSLPTHASLFTGLVPPRHRATAARIGEPDPEPGSLPARRLAENVPTLAELLARAGYRTLGISANYGYLSPTYGLDRGFQHYRARPNPVARLRGPSPWRIPVVTMLPIGPLVFLDGLPPFSWSEFFVGVPYERETTITDSALRVLEQVGDEPFFLFLNYMAPHEPYFAPAPFRRRFEGLDPALGEYGPNAEQLREVRTGRRALTRRERDHLTALYDGELAYLDSELDRLLRHLAERPDWPELMIVVTSDHGEAFGEHGHLLHGSDLYSESINVPLIIKPGRSASSFGPGSEIAGPLESVDVFATLLEHAGVEAPRDIDGIAWGRGRSSARSWLFRNMPVGIHEDRFERELHGIVLDGWKLVRSTPGRSELYDLALDPRERRDKARAERARRSRLEQLLVEPGPVVAQPGTTSAPSPETMELLRELGYIR